MGGGGRAGPAGLRHRGRAAQSVERCRPQHALRLRGPHLRGKRDRRRSNVEGPRGGGHAGPGRPARAGGADAGLPRSDRGWH